MQTKQQTIRIYAFGFNRNNISTQTLKNINYCYHKIQLFPNNMEFFFNKIIRDKPSHILGLGIYSRKDKEKIRIETVCTNQKGNIFLDKQHKEYFQIPYFLQPNNTHTKLGYRLGNSECNYVSYKIIKLILNKKLNIKYTFLHIPKNFSAIQAGKIINMMIEEYLRKQL